MILEHHQIMVYQRPGYDVGPLKDHPNVTIVEAPLLDISSSFIRELVKNDKSIQYLVPHSVFEYIDSNNMYK